VQWLIEKRGHERVAMICASHKFPVITRRYGAFQRAMQDAGLSVPPEYVVEGDWSVESGRCAIYPCWHCPNLHSRIRGGLSPLALWLLPKK
jgi:DNA-binding LacI/PurR family transcriptional regulator